MCLKRDIEYYSSSESIDIFENIDLEWPFEQVTGTKLIVACNCCFYPITFEEHIVDEIRDENNVTFGIVIPIKKLFKKVGIYLDNPLDEWQTRVFCPNCGVFLSFVNPYRHDLNEVKFAKIYNYVGLDEQIVILWTYPLFRGSEVEAYNRFKQIN